MVLRVLLLWWRSEQWVELRAITFQNEGGIIESDNRD